MGVLADRLATVARDYMGTWASGDKALAQMFGQGPSSAGVNITEETSLNISAVWACVQLIAGNLASLPLIHYRRQGNGDRERFTGSKLYPLLHDAPNEEMSAATFLETLQSHVLLWGNAFAEIQRDRAGRVASLYPIEPWRVSGVRPQGLAGDLRYRIAQRDGTDAILRPEELLHVPGLSSNGVWGYSVIRKARESMGLTMAEERFASTFFGKGSTFGGILSYPGMLSRENEQRLRASLEERHQGVERAHQFVILQGGVTYAPLGIPGRDAQFLQQRQFQLSEIARWYGVPPHLIGDVEKSTSWGSGIQQQTLGFLQFTLRRWLVKWEKELNRKLISPLERNLQLIEFNIDGLERGDQESRYRAYTTGIDRGFLKINEVRAMENLPRIEDGDITIVPSNMTTLEKLKAPDPAPTQPALTPARPAEDDEDARTEARIQRFARAVADAAAPREDRILARLDAVVIPDVDGARAAILAKLDEVAASNAARLEALDDRVESTSQGARFGIDELAKRVEALPAPPAPPTPADVAAAVAAALPPAPPPPEPLNLEPYVARLEERVAIVGDQTGALQSRLSEFAEEQRNAAEEARTVASRIEARPSPMTPEAMQAAIAEAVRAELAQIREEHRAQAERLGSLAPSLLAVIEAAVRAEARFESDRAVKAAQGGVEKLRAWLEAFYAGREDACVQRLLPTMRLHFQVTGRPEDAEEETRRLVRGHVEESRAALAAVLGDPENLEANVRALTERWAVARPKAVVEEFLREVVAHG